MPVLYVSSTLLASSCCQLRTLLIWMCRAVPQERMCHLRRNLERRLRAGWVSPPLLLQGFEGYTGEMSLVVSVGGGWGSCFAMENCLKSHKQRVMGNGRTHQQLGFQCFLVVLPWAGLFCLRSLFLHYSSLTGETQLLMIWSLCRSPWDSHRSTPSYLDGWVQPGGAIVTPSPDCAMPHGFPQLLCRPAATGVVDGKGPVHVIRFSHLEEKGVKARVMFEKPKPTHIHPASQDTCDGSLQQ